MVCWLVGRSQPSLRVYLPEEAIPATLYDVTRFAPQVSSCYCRVVMQTLAHIAICIIVQAITVVVNYVAIHISCEK